jgi:hypothetical protein
MNLLEEEMVLTSEIRIIQKLIIAKRKELRKIKEDLRKNIKRRNEVREKLKKSKYVWS